MEDEKEVKGKKDEKKGKRERCMETKQMGGTNKGATSKVSMRSDNWPSGLIR